MTIAEIIRMQLDRYHSTVVREEVEVNVSRDDNLMLVEIDCQRFATKRFYHKTCGEWVKGMGQWTRQEDSSLVVPGFSTHISPKLWVPRSLRHLLPE